MDDAKAAYLAQVSAALVKAFAEATALAYRADLGANFRNVLRQAQELHAIATEELAGVPEVDAKLRESVAAMGFKLAELAALAHDSTRH